MIFYLRARLRQYLRPAEDKLHEKLEKNPYYPFQMISPNVYYLTDRYKILYFDIFIFILCIVILIAWVSSNDISNNNYFLFPLMGIIASGASIYNHKSNRTYVLNLNDMYYTFSHGKALCVKSQLHNIYIRLKKEARSGSTVARRQDSYHLILNGFQIDLRKISGSTKNLTELRKLGQQIAFQLQINYFDEHNTSEFHVIRHFKPSKSSKPTPSAGLSMNQT